MESNSDTNSADLKLTENETQSLLKKKSNRFYYIDNLRIFISVFVILHHSARAYGPWGFWYFKEADLNPIFTGFFAVNAAWGMSTFFLISAYFMPMSYDRHGGGDFLKKRNIKFLGPIILFVILIFPIMMYVYYSNFRTYAPISFGDYFINYYLGSAAEPADWSGPTYPDLQLGHMWFIEHLFFYGIIYFIYRKIYDKLKPNHLDKFKDNTINFSFPSLGKMLLFTILLALITYLVRIKYEVNDWIGLFGFYQIEWAHIPHYVSAYFFGVYLYRRKLFQKIPDKTGKFWWTLGVSLGVAFYIVNYFVNLNDPSMLGGTGFPAFIYAFAETFMGMGLSIGILWVFKKYVTKTSPLAKKMAASSYMAYLVHVPILVLFQYLLGIWTFSVLLKYLIVCVIGVFFSFGLAILLRKNEFLKKNF